VQRCPLVVIVENNQFAYSTPTSKQTAAKAFVDKAAGYGVHGAQVDGNDVLAVYGAAREAVDRARAGEGTSLIEVMTYRRKGHAEHDAQPYQSKEEIERWASTNDPIDRYMGVLRENDWASVDELERIDSEVDEMLDRAVAEAEAGPMPEPDTALDDVYANERVAAPWTRHDPPDPRAA
jgi:TPP-dependent pyruvate/acetoin dehydrogenase alpha subunit